MGKEWWRVKQVLNAVNGSTLLGLAVAAAGKAQVSRGPRGMVLATGYTFSLPRARAFTIGNVVVTRYAPTWWEHHDRVLAHEEQHTWQYAVTGGLPMLPMYAVSAAWSYLRGGDWSTYNPFEVRAGLADGGYPLVSRRQQQRLERTA